MVATGSSGPKRPRVEQVTVRRVMRATVVCAVLALGAWAVIGQSAAVAGGSAKAVMQVSPDAGIPGQSVYVAAYAFPPSAVFQLQVCGDDALEGSPDCALTGGLTRATSEVGHFAGELTVLIPPVPCPCVVAAFSTALAQPITAAFTILGAPTAPLRYPPSPPRLVVKSAVLTGSGPLAAWFGAAPKRTLVLRVRNPATESVPNPIVLARIGNTPIPVNNLRGIGAGQVRIYRIPVTFPTLALGHYTVVGQVGAGNGRFARFDVGVLLLPWALLVVAFVILLLLLLLLMRVIRNRLQRRAQRTTQPPDSVGPGEPVVQDTTSPEEQMPAATETTI
jgi:hypothetical protein